MQAPTWARDESRINCSTSEQRGRVSLKHIVSGNVLHESGSRFLSLSSGSTTNATPYSDNSWILFRARINHSETWPEGALASARLDLEAGNICCSTKNLAAALLR